ncbi:MAG: EamA family transporter [Thermoplasmata archaeon]
MAYSPWSPRIWALFLLLVVFWGLNYPFVNVGLAFASPLWLATLRAGLGALATLVIVTGLRGWGTLDAAGRRDSLLLGLPNTALFFGLWFWAARSVLPGIAAVVIYTFPLWVAVLSNPVLGSRLTARHWVSVAIGFAGVALISQIGENGTGGVAWVAILELLAAAVAWAMGTVLFQRRFPREQMMEANAYQLIGGTVALLAATFLLTPTPIPQPTATLVGAVVWLGVVGTALAYAIWTLLLGRTRAATLSAFLFLVPVVALGVSAAYFGERLSLTQLAGVGLVLVSIYGIGRARWDPQSRQSPSIG